jgi:hypothetical protein
MKRWLTFLLFAFCCQTAHAQAIQSKACARNVGVSLGAGYVLPCTFDHQPIAGDLLVIPAIGICTVTCALPFTDSCGNTWQEAIVVPYYNGSTLWYALNAKPNCTPTINFITGGVWEAFLAEYPPATVLDSVSSNTYAGQNLDVAPGGSNDESWTWLETLQSGDLIIAWEFSGNDLNTLYAPTPGFGYTLLGAQYGDFMFESAWASGPGYYFPNVKWNNGGAHWTMGAAAFKMR